MPLENNQNKYFIAFNQISQIGPVRFNKIRTYFPNLKNAWQANYNELLKSGLEPKTAELITESRNKINPDKELEKVENLKIKIITIDDDDYPKLLRETHQAPALLYYYGDKSIFDTFTLAVVGSRKMSSYGREITQDLVTNLSKAGMTIVSGLALGVDTCAAKTALDNNGKTIAVLGGGLSTIYPANNRLLAQRIINSGNLVISEFPVGMKPLKQNFPRRNRIISGLSLGTLVTEAAEKSGALITADYALDQNREVFAIPGSIYNKNSVGPHQLIKAGAKLITEAKEILESLNLEDIELFQQAKETLPANKNEKIILDLLTQESYHIDKLSQLARLDISIINSTLAILEIKGAVKNLGNKFYSKSR